MKEIKQIISIKVCTLEELSSEDRTLIETARFATYRSYAPYSNFHVGAAVRLANGEIISGTNQENAAYPSGLCAERTALFYANSQYPDQAVCSIAIAARTQDGFLNKPIPPCGSCRQVLLETENRFKSPIRILLDSTKDIYMIEGASSLLPLSFNEGFFK